MTRLIYASAEDEAADKAQVHAILVALDAAHTQYGKDECGAWAVRGKKGYAAASGDPGRAKWLLYCQPRTKGKWNNIRRALTSIGNCTQNGDDEGIFVFDRLPTPDEATYIRKVVGFRKRQPATAGAFKPLAAL